MANKQINLLINARDNASATFAKVAATIGGVFAAGKLASYGKDIINLSDGIGKAAARAGTSAEEWQKLSYAAERSGASSEAVEASFKKMSKTIFDAGNGSKAAADQLASLGLSADRLKRLSPEQQFAEIAKRLNLVSSATDKAAIAQDIFGRGGTQLLPMIGNYEELGKHLESIGGIINNDVIAASESFNDQLTDLKASITALVANSGFIQWLNDVTKAINEMGGATKSLKLIAETAAEESTIFSMLTGGMFNKAPIRNKPTGQMATTQGATFQAAPTAGEVAAKAAEVAAEKQRAAEVAAAVGKAAKDSWVDGIDEVEKGFADMMSRGAKGAGGFGDQGPQSAEVVRFLSGSMNSTIKPAQKTAEATSQLVALQKDQIKILTDMKKVLGVGGGTSTLQPAPAV